MYLLFYSIHEIQKVGRVAIKFIGPTNYIMFSSNETLKNYFDIWWRGIKSIPDTTSIHGFRFIADSQRHWTER